MKTGKRTVLLCGGSLVDALNNSQHTALFGNYISCKCVLVYLFARTREKWPATMRDLESSIASRELKIQWELASIDRHVRECQLRAAEAVLILGGDEMRFFEEVSTSELAKVLDKRFVGAASAGVNVFSSCFYSTDHNEIRQGAGLLPIKTICHFKEQRRVELSQLEKFSPGDRLLPLRENQIEILELT